MRNIERACARILEEGKARAAQGRPYEEAEAQRFVAEVLREEGVRPWPPWQPNGEIEFYAGQLILESHRPARVIDRFS
jgi:hypothetical protein